MKPQINLAQYTSTEALNAQVKDLIQKLEEVEEEKNSYETLVEIITEHSTGLENQIHHKNREMQTYIHQVIPFFQNPATVAVGCVATNNFAGFHARYIVRRTLHIRWVK